MLAIKQLLQTAKEEQFPLFEEDDLDEGLGWPSSPEHISTMQFLLLFKTRTFLDKHMFLLLNSIQWFDFMEDNSNYFCKL